VKTHAVDARTLAHRLRADLPPDAYVEPRELRENAAPNERRTPGLSA
jgi:hypothetical protein